MSFTENFFILFNYIKNIFNAICFRGIMPCCAIVMFKQRFEEGIATRHNTQKLNDDSNGHEILQSSKNIFLNL